MRTILAVALAAGLAGPAAAAVKLGWAKQPTDAELAATWPAEAASKGIEGRVALRCKASGAGVLSDCSRLYERPSGMGFGDAAMKLVPSLRAHPRTDAGADGREVTVALDWVKSVDTAPDWLRRPTPEQLLLVWPVEAAKQGRSGGANVECQVGVQGTLLDCMTVDEWPIGAGFGMAAIALTPQFLMRPATRGGKPVPSYVNLPIRFQSQGSFTMPEGRAVVQAAMAWHEAASVADVTAAYPEKARAAGIGGRALLSCGFAVDGRLRNCDVISETPRSQGFGAAAMKLSKLFRAPPAGDSSVPLTKAGVQLPITFDAAVLTGKPAVGKTGLVTLPTGADFQAAFSSIPDGSSVRVMLRCTVQPGGWLGQCRVESEEPTGLGVGAASLSLSNRFRVRTWTAEGLPVVGGEIGMPIRYQVEDGGPTPAKP